MWKVLYQRVNVQLETELLSPDYAKEELGGDTHPWMLYLASRSISHGQT